MGSGLHWNYSLLVLSKMQSVEGIRLQDTTNQMSTCHSEVRPLAPL